MTKKYFFISLLLIPIIASTQQLTLVDAINIALKKNYDIEIAKDNVNISKINNHIGNAGGLTTVSATLSNQEAVTNINQKINTGTEIDKTGALTNTLNANITGSMLLYNGYRVVATKKRLEELQLQNQQQLTAQIQNTIAAVMLKYYDIVKQQSYVRTLQQSIAVSQQQLQLIEVKKEIGLANNADVFQIKIDVNTKQQDFASQELIIKQAKTDLLNLLTLKTDSSIVIKDTIVSNGEIKFETIANTLQQNADILSLDNQIKINELIEKETKTQRMPSLRANTGLNFGRTQSDAGQLLLNQSYGPFIGLSLSFPIYNSGNIKRQEQVANINTSIAKKQKQKAVETYQTQLCKTYQAYVTAIEQGKIQQNTYQLSQDLMQLVLQKFQLGQATIIEVREAQKSFEDSGFRLINLNYLAKIAEIELKRIGNLLN
ncbi:MAG: TolC family protein [Bacteroidetes bacterium]|nr:TolC family protein [Bacteroidota bacterium]